MGRTFQFVVPDVKGKGRPRAFVPKGQKKPQTFTDHKTVKFESLVRSRAFDAGVQPLPYCRIDIAICLPCRVKEFKKKPNELREPRMRPDVDNVEKAVLDALDGLAYKNDKDVLETHTKLRFTTDSIARTVVRITEVQWKDYIRESNGR